VLLTENHLFALSSSRLDVYTSRCLSQIIFDLEETADPMQVSGNLFSSVKSRTTTFGSSWARQWM